MRRDWVIRVLFFGGVLFAVLAAVSPSHTSRSPYLSALSELTVRPAHAETCTDAGCRPGGGSTTICTYVIGENCWYINVPDGPQCAGELCE